MEKLIVLLLVDRSINLLSPKRGGSKRMLAHFQSPHFHEQHRWMGAFISTEFPGEHSFLEKRTTISCRGNERKAATARKTDTGIS
ncbi:hypothetical protein DV515_00002925 [Chloebia gouldiae]|uniref:Uncharacterized protein n=1 Tax=Chloebia gouldiae TaxID=44316 RepID=A0A3L8SXV8_CHLGU|nr:hypothetical protein DV515_00002925 [Chloebia gouldiae]